MRLVKFTVLAVILLVMSGCATQPATRDFAPRDVLPTGKRIDYELKSILVSIAKKDESLGKTYTADEWYDSSFNQAFKDSLEEALTKAAIFNDLSIKKLNLSAKVLQFESPLISYVHDTTFVVRYQLLDRPTGKLVFTRDVRSTGVVPFDYGLTGIHRFTEARNRAVRSNIEQFIASLGEFKE